MKIRNMMALCLSLSLAVAPMAVADTEAIPQDTETQETDTTSESPAVEESEEDDLDALINDALDVKLKYEYEVELTDDYELPEKIAEGNKRREVARVNEFRAAFLKDIDDAQPVKSMMAEYVKEVAQKLKDKKEVKDHLERAALVGFQTKKGKYVGPLQLCLLEAEDNLLYNDRKVSFFHGERFYKRFIEDKMKTDSGKFKGSDKLQFTYETSIVWKKGLPYKVKCSVDFTPSKDKLTKKEKE